MFKSTVKKSNIINNLIYTQVPDKVILNKINIENNQKPQKTFLLDDSKKRLIPKYNEDKRLFYTKSEINFKPKKSNEEFNKINNNKNDDFHSIKKEKFLQKLKDMIFSPGDINYNGKELNENGGMYNNNYNIKNSKNIIKTSNISKVYNTKVNLLPNKLDSKKTLVLDLDETLIHSAFESFKPKDDITLTMKLKEEDITIHVLKRPYLDEFLNIVTQKYEVVIFTASISDYANPLLDQLDPYKKISHRLFREHCTKSDNGLFIKDLNRLGRDLKDVIIIDNNPVSFTFNKDNGLPILTWHSIQTDNELIKLIPLLTYLSTVDDIRPVINKIVNGYYVNYKEVNKIINNKNNNYALNNINSKEEDYFNNWFSTSKKKLEKKNSYKYSNNKDNNIEMDLGFNKDKNSDNNNKISAIKRKESFDHIIKYKGLLGSKEQLNFDEYKKSKHTKLFSGFLNDNITEKNNGGNNQNFLFLDNNNENNNRKDNNYNNIFDSKLEKRRNHSSKNLIKISKKINNVNDMNYINAKKIKKDMNQHKNKDMSFTKYQIDFLDNSKLNKTDSNIKINNQNDYQNIIMNNNTNIINNNIFLISNKQSTIDENSKAIDYSNNSKINIINESMNRTFKNGYQSANYFYIKKERAQSAEYKQRQVNQNKNISNLIDDLINYNQSNKKQNINSNQLIAISNNSKYLNNEKTKTNHKINHLIINNESSSKNLYNIYNINISKRKNLLDDFINNKINFFKINNINSNDLYNKSKSNIYVNTGNNLESYTSKSKKGSFLYDDTKFSKKINKEYNNNYQLTKNKTIKYLSSTSNFKLNLYK